MKTTNKTSRTVITLAVSVFALAATVVAAGAEGCYLAQQLAAPAARAQYQRKIAEAREAATSRFGENIRYSVKFSFSPTEEMEVDSYSYDCMLCHDGMNAKYHDIRFRSGQRRQVSLDTVLGAHPIGMHYGTMAYENAKLRHQSTLDSSVALIDGRVGCLSCHDMLNQEKFHLVVGTDNSELCFKCHIK